jgi:hypothetical protein
MQNSQLVKQLKSDTDQTAENIKKHCTELQKIEKTLKHQIKNIQTPNL